MSQNNVINAYHTQGVAQNVAYTGTAGAITNGVSEGVNIVEVTVTTAAYVVENGVATTANGRYCVANLPYLFKVRKGDKPSAIQATTGGSMFVSELTH